MSRLETTFRYLCDATITMNSQQDNRDLRCDGSVKPNMRSSSFSRDRLINTYQVWYEYVREGNARDFGYPQAYNVCTGCGAEQAPIDVEWVTFTDITSTSYKPPGPRTRIRSAKKSKIPDTLLRK